MGKIEYLSIVYGKFYQMKMLHLKSAVIQYYCNTLSFKYREIMYILQPLCRISTHGLIFGFLTTLFVIVQSMGEKVR